MRSYTYILIEAGEGYTDHVYLASGSAFHVLTNLIAATALALSAADKQARPAWGDWHQWHAERGTALLARLADLGPLEPGRHVLPAHAPWGECTLIIAVGDRAYIDDAARAPARRPPG